MLRMLMLALALPASALAAPQAGCPPLGALPDFVPGASVLRAYDGLEFERTLPSGETGPVLLFGRTCVTFYALPEGKDAPSNLEIQTNYRAQLAQLGAEVTSAGGRDTYARLVRGGVETWMRVYSSESSIETTVLEVVPPKLTLLPPSGSDHRLVGHMPDFVAGKPAGKAFDSMDFAVDEDGEEKTVTAQGRTSVIGYSLREGRPVPSNPELRFNYREALRAQGAEILHDAGRTLTARLLDKGGVVWVGIAAGETSVEVSVLEEKPFVPSIQPAVVQAAAMQAGLRDAGRVALYVNFDFDRATLRPDAAAVVAQVAAMLKAEPGLRLGIEGHTDAVGTPERNRALSLARARAFAAALAAQGVAADRLVAAGFGPDKPVAGNDTSEGRARNRRVELVRL